MRKSKSYLMVAVVTLLVGVLAAALAWGIGAAPALAVPDQVTATKSVTPDEVPPGGTASYTIVVTNPSASTLDVTVMDELDANLGSVSNVSVEPEGTALWDADTPGYITFTDISLVAGASITLSFDAQVDADVEPGTPVTNTATVDDGTTTVDTNDAVFTVSPAPGIQIYDPDNGNLITQRESVEVSGFVWTEFDPPPFPEAPVLQPVDTFQGDGTFKLTWTSVITDGIYQIQESLDRETWTDLSAPESPVSAPTTETWITGRSAGTYYYRVVARNTENRPSRWSNVQMVEVTGSSVTSASIDAEAALAPTQINVEVSVDGGTTWNSAVVTDVADKPWYEWSYMWDPADDLDGEEVTIMARASYDVGGEVTQDTITVVVDNDATILYMPIIFKRYPPIPYPPVLTISDPGETNDYTVSWTYDHPDVPVTQGYELQEATDASFTENVQTYTVSGTSQLFTDKPDDTYYYRVRGRNSFGWGEWSAVKSVTVDVVQDRIYNFSNSLEGWDIARTDTEQGSDETPDPLQRNGVMYHLIWGRFDQSILSPMEEGPSAPYTIEARVDIVDGEEIRGDWYEAKTGMTWGILFGANGDEPCPAYRIQNGCFEHYYRLLITWDQANGAFKWSLKRIDWINDRGEGQGIDLIGWQDVGGFQYNASDWNEWRIEVTEASTNNIKVYMNDNLLGQATDHEYITEKYFGTFMASTELGAMATKWDWFRVER